jgi:hypothetical protein
MLCSFKFELPVDPIGLMAMVKRMILENGGKVTGEIPNISISVPTALGPVEGSCRMTTKSVVNIQVDKMPEFVSCNQVREKLVYFITEAVKLYVEQQRAASAAPKPASGEATV